jgi:hypothetical protein
MRQLKFSRDHTENRNYSLPSCGTMAQPNAPTARPRNLRTHYAVVMAGHLTDTRSNRKSCRPNVNFVLFIHFTQAAVHCPTSWNALHIEFCTKLGLCFTVYVVRYSSFGIANRYGLDGPGIEYRWGSEIFCTRPDLP